MMQTTLPIAIYYEQPHWFKPLFAELDQRGTPYVKLYAPDHYFAPEDHPEEKYSLVFNRMSPSAWNRDHGDQIFYTLSFLEHLESRGVKVINGFKAFSSELSKAGQLVLMDKLNIPYPKARVIHRAAQAEEAVVGLRWPIVVKPNIGGSGAGVKRFDHLTQLQAAIAARPQLPRRATVRPRLHRTSTRVHPRRRRAHRPRRSPQRQIPLRHQGPHHRRNLRPLPRRHL